MYVAYNVCGEQCVWRTLIYLIENSAKTLGVVIVISRHLVHGLGFNAIVTIIMDLFPVYYIYIELY